MVQASVSPINLNGEYTNNQSIYVLPLNPSTSYPLNFHAYRILRAAKVSFFYHMHINIKHDSKILGEIIMLTFKSDNNTNWKEILKKQNFYKSRNQCGDTYSATQIEELQRELNETGKNKIKRNADLNFSVIKGTSGDLFSLYHGAITSGDYGRLKFARNLNNGELYLMKQQTYVEIDAEFEKEETIRERFDRECQFSHIAGIHVDERYIDDKHNYQFIRIIEGVPLSHFIEIIKNQPLTALEEAKLALSFLKALERLSKNNIKHRDLHPGNIMIDPIDMKVTFIDYGKAQELQTVESDSEERDEYSEEENISDIEEATKSILRVFQPETDLHLILRNLKRDRQLHRALDSVNAYKVSQERKHNRNAFAQKSQNVFKKRKAKHTSFGDQKENNVEIGITSDEEAADGNLIEKSLSLISTLPCSKRRM